MKNETKSGTPHAAVPAKENEADALPSRQFLVTLSGETAKLIEERASLYSVTPESILTETLSGRETDIDEWDACAKDAAAHREEHEAPKPPSRMIVLDPDAEAELQTALNVWNGLTAEALIGSLASHALMYWVEMQESDDTAIEDLDTIRALLFQVNGGKIVGKKHPAGEETKTKAALAHLLND